MGWISPDHWISACGAVGDRMRAPFVARGGEQMLLQTLDDDPRRIAALVGKPGAGSSRLALEIAKTAPLALYPDPVEAPDPPMLVRELQPLLAEFSGHRDATGSSRDAVGASIGSNGKTTIGCLQRPVVVLDGPNRDECLRPLAALAAHVLHPRLLILVPCHPREAQHLAHVAGDYPRTSILVAEVAGQAAPPRPLTQLLPPKLSPADLLPFALAGRCASGVFDHEQDLVEAGLLARHRRGNADSTTTACLLDERTRFAVVSQMMLASTATRSDHRPGVALFDQHPALRPAALETVLRWTGGTIPAPLIEPFLAFGATDFPDPDALLQRGVPLSAETARLLQTRAEILLANNREGEPRPDQYLRLYLARLSGDKAQLRAALDVPRADRQGRLHGRLLDAWAGAQNDPALCAQAVKVLRAAGDHCGVSRSLQRWTRMLHLAGRLDEALQRCREWIAHEHCHGSAASCAAAELAGASIAGEQNDAASAVEFAERACRARRAIGDVRGRVYALYRIATLRAELGQTDAAERAIVEALQIEEQIDNPHGVAYCEWMLGTIDDKRVRPVSAARHYSAAMAAYRASGHDIPAAVQHALAAAQRANSGPGKKPDPAPEHWSGPAQEHSPTDSLDRQPRSALVEQLVQLTRKANRP
ncbi:MAG: hypothetical protein MJE77_40820 [Proteobacteria bacterium]|nr:hypothetical protein [Pseudomonadota bacterium]